MVWNTPSLRARTQIAPRGSARLEMCSGGIFRAPLALQPPPPPTRSRIKLLGRCESSSDHERTNECMAVRSQLTGVLWTLQTVPRQPAFPPYPAHIRCVLSIPTPNWASPCIYRTNTGRPICSENARNRPRNQPRQKVREISIAKVIEMEKGANGTKKSMLRLGNGGSENVMTSSRALRQAVTSHVTTACCRIH